jgi:hypothetical protein
MKVSYLTDAQVREAYLLLLTRIDSYRYLNHVNKEDFWKDLDYERDEIPEF